MSPVYTYLLQNFDRIIIPYRLFWWDAIEIKRLMKGRCRDVFARYGTDLYCMKWFSLFHDKMIKHTILWSNKKKFVYIFNASVFVGHMAHFAPNARSESIFCKLKTANTVTAYWTIFWWVQFLISRRMFSSKATLKKKSYKIVTNCSSSG